MAEFFNFFCTFKFEILNLFSIFILTFYIIFSQTISVRSVIHLSLILALSNVLVFFLPDYQNVLFHNVYEISPKINFIKLVVQFAGLLVIIQSCHWFSSKNKPTEFYLLIFSCLLGLNILVSSTHILLFYLALELISFPLIMVISFDFNCHKSSAAALKFFFINAISSAFILYGISSIYLFNPNLLMNGFLKNAIQENNFYSINLLFIIGGLAVKLTLAPFHFWVGEVYEGSPTPISFLLTVLPKIGYIVVILKLIHIDFTLNFVNKISTEVFNYLAALSVICGNILALKTQHIKRFLAYSSISQMGYLFFGILSPSTIAYPNYLYFILTYLFANFVIFYIVNRLEILYRIDQWHQLNGLISVNKHIVIFLSISLISLAGIPPTIGFFGKYYLILGSTYYTYWSLIILLANLLISVMYYFNIIKIFFSEETPTHIKIPTNSVKIFNKLEFSILYLSCFIIIFSGFYTDFFNYIINVFK